MSSSGIIYAIIVGAWAVYLVPMWLRREDELNRARQTQRYAAAIKVLANKEAFERRLAQASEAEADEALPLAAGQGSVPVTRTTKRASGNDARGASAARSATRPAKRQTVGASGAAAVAATATRNVATAKIADGDTRASSATHATRSRAATAAQAPSATGNSASTTSASSTGQKAPNTSVRTRTGLMARRRRVVALLFAFSTLGALVSADLGAGYLWAMAIPAVLLSVYIARLRRDERIRATARVAKRAAAQEAREVELARAEAEAARVEAAQAEAARAEARAEAEHRRHTEAARRRASSAARARAQAFTQEAPDLRKASNG